MRSGSRTGRLIAAITLCLALTAAASTAALAHCDTMDGPVIKDAELAVQKGDITPVMKWLKPTGEAEVRAAFDKAMLVRTKGPEAKELADRYFFETLVRVHRAGEGAPYDGLKPAGIQDQTIVLADTALDKGSVDAVAKEVTEAVADGIRERFKRVHEAKKHANDSVQAGREYVEAYVEYVHYVERLHNDAAGGTAHKAEAAQPQATHACDQH